MPSESLPFQIDLLHEQTSLAFCVCLCMPYGRKASGSPHSGLVFCAGRAHGIGGCAGQLGGAALLQERHLQAAPGATAAQEIASLHPQFPSEAVKHVERHRECAFFILGQWQNGCKYKGTMERRLPRARGLAGRVVLDKFSYLCCGSGRTRL